MRTEALLDRELELVLRALTPQNALVCQVSLRNGVRVSDVLALRTEQLAPHFWIVEKKTGKRKQIGLPGPLLDAIRAQAGEVWAFPGRDPAKPRTRQAVWRDVKRAAAAFRLPHNVGAHSFRKSYACDVLAKYGDIDRVRRALNHSSESVTLLYVMAALQLERRTANKPARFGRRL